MTIQFRRSARTGSRRGRNYKKKILPSAESYRSHADFSEMLTTFINLDALPIIGLIATASFSAIVLILVLAVVF